MKRKINILLVVVMTLVMLTACGGDGNSNPNTDVNAGNEESIISGTEGGDNETDADDAGSAITDFSGFEGKYWYLMDYVDDGMGLCKYGFYLDGNGTMTQVTCYQDGRYEESTCKYDSLTAEKTEEGIVYTFNRYYGGGSEPVEGCWVVNAEGRISQQFWAEDGEFYCDYSPVDAGEFYAKNESSGGGNGGTSGNGSGDGGANEGWVDNGSSDEGNYTCDHATSGRTYATDPSNNHIHTEYCDRCNALVAADINCEHNQDGICRCGNVCTHENGTYLVWNDDDTHVRRCENWTCGLMIFEKHSYVYDRNAGCNKCSVCGYEEGSED